MFMPEIFGQKHPGYENSICTIFIFDGKNQFEYFMSTKTCQVRIGNNEYHDVDNHELKQT